MITLQQRLEAMAGLCDTVVWNADRTGYYGKRYIGCGEFIREYTYIHGNGIKTVARIF